MERCYTVMREVLTIVAKSGRTVCFDGFMRVHQRDKVVSELQRLSRDGLISGKVSFDDSGVCEVCEIEGLTDEGREFYNLIENDRAWGLMLKTLESAQVDVSYPLLKEVCEEIVKRYVASFIPDLEK